jgi:hypothetical protein
MQHNVPAAIFSHGTIFCLRRSVGAVGVVGAVGTVGAVCAACFPRLRHTERVITKHNKTCVTHNNTMCVRRVFLVLVKCFSGEKVLSAASVHSSAFAVHGAINFMRTAIFFSRAARAAKSQYSPRLLWPQ